MVARDGVEPFWGVRYQSNPLESRTALSFRDSRDSSTVQIQYTAERSFLAVEFRVYREFHQAEFRRFGLVLRYVFSSTVPSTTKPPSPDNTPKIKLACAMNAKPWV